MTCPTCRGLGCTLEWGISFCDCPAGVMGRAFYVAAAAEYFRWMREQRDANQEHEHHD